MAALERDVAAELVAVGLPECIVGLITAMAARTDAEKVHDWIATLPTVRLDTGLMMTGCIAFCMGPGPHIAHVRHTRVDLGEHVYFRRAGCDTYITYHTSAAYDTTRMHSAARIAEWARKGMLKQFLQAHVSRALLEW